MATIRAWPHRLAFPPTRDWRVTAIWVGLLLLVGLCALALTQQRRQIEVVVEVDGQPRTLHTPLRDPARLLDSLGYRAAPGDHVLFPASPLESGARLSIQRSHPVIITADGSQRQVWTHAATVGAALTEAGVHLGPADEVWQGDAILTTAAAAPGCPLPASGVQPLDAEPLAISLSIRRALAMTVVDGAAIPARIFTTAGSVGEALAQTQTPLYPGDLVFPPLASPAQTGLTIVIQRSMPFEVTVDGATLITRTRQSTVAAALSELGVTVMGQDVVSPTLAAPLDAFTAVKVTRVRESILYEDTPLPFETIWQPDDDLPIDATRVAAAGGQGLRRQRYRLRFEDGVEVARVLEAAWMAAQPETRIIAYGRKITPQTLETPDGLITYWRKVRIYANSYSPARSGTSPSAPWYGRTRLGMQLRKGIIAVDPAVVNMSQQLYVPGYGVGIAGDTGGGVRGKHIDLGYSDNDYVSWHRWVDVYFLWPPPASHSINYVLPNWPRFPDRGG